MKNHPFSQSKFSALLKDVHGLVLAAILMIGISLFVFIIINSQTTSLSQQAGHATNLQQSSPTPTGATVFLPLISQSQQADSTAGWSSASADRSNIRFTFKHPPMWSDPYDHCNELPNPKALNLSANCIKSVVFTDNLPGEDVSTLASDVVLISELQTKVRGYKATRRLYAFLEDETKTPDTYELWIYDQNNRPFILWLASIGEGTDLQTATDFVQVLDRMVNTLEISSH